MPNRLASEKSPYLLQHAENPVDWYPWSDAALERARVEDRPILVSIGYSACHWCHVMEHESFEDPDTAALMNERFVNIKVDREERPDVDSVYMAAVQAMTGQGGWPLNVFLTPDGHPFYGGTYFPSQARHGLPSWTQVLDSVSSAFRERRDDVTHNANVLTDYVRQAQEMRSEGGELSADVLRTALATARTDFDWQEGGFGGAPKFPQPLSLQFLLRMHDRWGDTQILDFVSFTLQKMANGGIFDQLGGGFHRYTVDGEWTVPHFEKMLYDNAILASLYLDAFRVTGNGDFRRVTEGTLDYLIRDMLSKEGGFYSAEDADSEGIEGKFYVWRLSEISSLLPERDARVFALAYGVSEKGNFEGATILTRVRSDAALASDLGMSIEQVESSLYRSRQVLLAARATRTRPAKDTKILAAWNGLAIRAFASAGRILARADYLDVARAAADFVWGEMRPEGRLIRSYRDGPSSIHGFLEDHGYLVEAYLTLYEATATVEYLRRAESLAETMIELFWHDANGFFYDTPADAVDPVVRPRSYFDNPIPSGGSAATFALLRLHGLRGDERSLVFSERSLRSVVDLCSRAPLGLAYWLCSLDFYLAPPIQVAIVGPEGAERQALADVVWRRYLPNSVLAVGNEGDSGVLEDRRAWQGQATAYVCRHFTCRLPVTDVAGLEQQLSEAKVRE